jgi:hypothetical protein
MDGIDGTNCNGDRLYESMQDQALTERPLTFPIMGWPYYVKTQEKNFVLMICYSARCRRYLYSTTSS